MTEKENMIMFNKKLPLILAILILTIANESNAQEKTCNINPQKKAFIADTLCGKTARETAYQFSGIGCAKRSIEKRLEDSAIQINIYKICSDEQFAIKIKDATLKSMAFMEKLLPCTGENFSLDQIMRERSQYVEQKSKSDGVTCDSNMRSMVRNRKPKFQKIIEMANDPNTEKMIFDKIGVAISDSGSVVDK